jgi:hypothetical protein
MSAETLTLPPPTAEADKPRSEKTEAEVAAQIGRIADKLIARAEGMDLPTDVTAYNSEAQEGDKQPVFRSSTHREGSFKGGILRAKEFQMKDAGVEKQVHVSERGADKHDDDRYKSITVTPGNVEVVSSMSDHINAKTKERRFRKPSATIESGRLAAVPPPLGDLEGIPYLEHPKASNEEISRAAETLSSIRGTLSEKALDDEAQSEQKAT